MTDTLLASRSFGLSDQIAFARLSSDYNPMHLDAAFARRTQFGASVVHGIHTLAWATNAVLQSCPFRIANIRARFPQPLYLDEPAHIRIQRRTDAQIEFCVVAADTVVTQIRLSAQPGKFAIPASQPAASSAPAPRSEPANPGFEQLAGQAGAVAIGDGDIRAAFPALIDSIGLAAVGALLATSEIVGMACPGLHSLFAGLDVNCRSDSARDSVLTYAVRKTDARFRSLQIEVFGSGIAGRLDAFARQPPPSQPRMTEIMGRTAGKPYSGQKSLIVGGSRGLGEVTAKIVAAGGGHPVITYQDGKHDAERVAAEIRAAGSACDILRYDALQPAAGQLAQLGAVDCCYYFATPKIFQRKSALYEPEKLRAFLAFYADGFSDLCTALAPDEPARLAVFYPSTVAIDQATAATAEYAMAKMAGEILAKHIGEFMPGIEVVCRRLPRILTDQTATVGVASTVSTLDAMLPIVYEVQQTARPDKTSRG